VKVLFDPVDHVVFDGMSRGRLKRVLLIASRPAGVEPDARLRSMGEAIAAGKTEFCTVRVTADGVCQLE
jgi:predicted Holliday junction resolvase-like endonuclease